jgi:hypothetical protein
VNETSIPVALELVRKPIAFGDLNNRKQKRLSEVTQNELRRDRLNTAVRNALEFKWVLFDTWLSSTENMTPIKLTLEKDLVGALKTNRLVALSEEDKAPGGFTRPIGLVRTASQTRRDQRDEFPGSAGTSSLYQPGRKHGQPVSGR